MDLATFMALVQTTNSLFGGNQADQVIQRSPMPDGGPSAANIESLFGPQNAQQGPQPAQTPTLGIGQSLAAAQAAAPKQTPIPPVTSPNKLEAPAKEGKPQKDKEIGVGEILAQVPAAIESMSNLLGLNPTGITQKAAPVAGGQPGQVVGQFGQQPIQNDIGRILAQLGLM